MSWPTWSANAPPIPTGAVAATPIQSTLLSANVNSAPSVLPPGLQYSPEQWAQAQQQNWQQWAQWQQQYQQWHQQYGAEYQKSITAMQSTVPVSQPPLPTLANTSIAPPLPIEHKPPLPPEDPPLNQASTLSSYSTMPIKTSQPGYSTTSLMMTSQLPANQRQGWQQKRPYGQETEYIPVKKPLIDQWGSQKENPTAQPAYTQPPPQIGALKANAEELSEAEKKFDKEFAAWEAQFQKWKEQNVNHPDKTQYREYEKKWESWRNSLLERREQMRKKRLALASSAAATLSSKVPNFTQPPPTINQQTTTPVVQQSLENPASCSSSGIYTSLPPHQNNEPLSFKNQGDQINTGASFLGTTSSTGGIPGLDLVKDEDKDHDIDDIQNKGPDLEAISKGINTILGDQKLLNMLSMVTKHPPPAPVQKKIDFTTQPPIGNYQENQYTKMSLPPPTTPYRDHYNDQSNQSFEDRSNQDDHHQRETVTNFDDQTRSSFTMGPNDPDQSFRNRVQSVRFADDKFGGGGFGTSVPKSNLDNLAPKSLLSLTFPPGGPKMTLEECVTTGAAAKISADNFGPNNSRNNFGRVRNDNSRHGQRGPENFNRFSAKSDFLSDFVQGNRGNSYKRNDRFDNDQYGKGGRDNFPGNNDRYDNYNDDRCGNSYGGEGGGHSFSGDNIQEDDYVNYNEDEDYDKYHTMYNEDEPNYEDDNYSYNNRSGYANKGYKDQHHSQELLASNEGIPSAEALLPEPNVPVPPHIQESPPRESIFEPAKVIDYDHKSLQKPDFEVTVEPLHMFDYRHKPLNRIHLTHRPKWLSECVKFIREFDPLASRVYERSSMERIGRFSPVDRNRCFERDRVYHDYDREGREYENLRRDYERDGRKFEKMNIDYDTEREDFRYEKKTYKNEKGSRFDDDYDNEKDRKRHKSDNGSKCDFRSFDNNGPKKSEEKIVLKDAFEELSDEDMDWEAGERNKLHHQSDQEKNKSRSSSPILSNPPNPSNTVGEIQMMEDIINQPGRFSRPPRIVIILRGPPGSGKTYLARLIKDKEVENGGSAPRILSLDDYFMVEHEKTVVEDGKNVTVKEMVYEYEAEMEESYRSSFGKSFKKTITDGYFPFIIVDNVNDKVKYFGEMWSFAKQNGFQVYICQLDLDPVLCTKRNIHNRTEAEIEECIAGWEPTPSHHPTIDVTSFLQSNQIKEVEMEVVQDKTSEEEHQKNESAEDHVRSKWDTFDYSSNNLAKLDGVNKPLRKNRTMEEYLQMEWQWQSQRPTKPGQKRVRWADLEEQRELEKMKAIGFVVGQTDWNRMMDPSTAASRALTQTKYI